MGSRGAADSIGEDRLLELSSRDVLWPEAIACSVASVVGLHLVLGALSLQGSRTSSHVQKGFIPEERLRRRAGSSELHYSCLPMAFMPSCPVGPALSLVDTRCTNSTIAGCSVERMQVQ